MASSSAPLLNTAYLDEKSLRFHQRLPGYYNEVLIDTAELGRRIRLDAPSTWSQPKSSQIDGGNISKLPLETVIMILHITPISDLFKLRSTNSYFKYLIEQWEPFNIIYQHGGDAIRALLATGAGRLWTATQLEEVLFTTRCEFCGDHGEIIQLLKLQRCCMRCLSQERRLLAVSADYALFCMGLSLKDIEMIPHLKAICQKFHWGPVNDAEQVWGNAIVLDYAAALEAAAHRVWHHSYEYKALPNRKYDLVSTGKMVEGRRRTRKPRRRAAIHSRRGHLSELRLPPCVIAPPETEYRQHAGAVRVPAMKRHSGVQDGQVIHKVMRIDAVHCQGCAYYWNYHSPMPYMYHKLYPSDDSGGPSEFTEHLQNCFYAHCHWTIINNPWGHVELWKRIRFLDSRHRFFWARNPADTPEESNQLFEKVSDRLLLLLQHHYKDYRSFDRPYEWPELPPSNNIPGSEEERLVRRRTRLRIKNRAKQAAENEHPYDWVDQHCDMLVGQEAVSQSNWACAHLHNGSSAVLKGPERWLMAKRERWDRKFWAKNTVDSKQPPWGFDRF